MQRSSLASESGFKPLMLGAVLPPGVNSESCPVFEYAIFNYGLMFGSLESEVQQHMEITLDGLIWDLGVFNYGFG